MASENVYLVTNNETGKRRLVRAPGIVGARNHAADATFKVEYLKAGPLMDLMAEGLPVEVANEKADGAGSNSDGGNDGQ